MGYIARVSIVTAFRLLIGEKTNSLITSNPFKNTSFWINDIPKVMKVVVTTIDSYCNKKRELNKI